MSIPNETEALWHALFDHCEAERTGTFFLACADNKSGQIVLHNGQILGLTYAGANGDGAAEALNRAQGLRFSFTAELIFPLQETLLPEQAQALLSQLGIAEYQRAESPASKPQTEVPRRSVRIYRGRVVQG
ncbi:hypothetical protein [Marinobacterium lutimaris]|uniref:DUF4388 domain-containing protein n=1 Tax=Marinobacterium lutimaris TaxID=568106 RepID=A0A1H5YKN9_9GAMM|nr:hypothetical protein [Marinobacterium lutimaris]SEG24703.1 hypothetical protein SAMN05444390_1011807 [Marinobacterium lutimaris]